MAKTISLMLQREPPVGRATPGKLFVDGVFECFTLEDLERPLGPKGEGKIPGETAIPAGIYPVVIAPSPKFKRMMPRLLEVPHFTGILIHGGNTHEDTQGCILVGQKLTQDGRIAGGTSTPAYRALFDKLEGVFEVGGFIRIEVRSAEAVRV